MQVEGVSILTDAQSLRQIGPHARWTRHMSLLHSFPLGLETVCEVRRFSSVEPDSKLRKT